MYLLKTIIFIGLAVHLTHCGGQNNNESTVKVAKVENGVAKAEDGRVILSSQSEGDLVIPEGTLEGLRIDQTKLANVIAKEVEDVSRVYDLFMASSLSLDDFNILGRLTGFYDGTLPFITSFSVKTHSGDIYHGIECQTRFRLRSAVSSDAHLILVDCENDQVEVSFGGYSVHVILLRQIVVDEQELSKKINEL